MIIFYCIINLMKIIKIIHPHCLLHIKLRRSRLMVKRWNWLISYYHFFYDFTNHFLIKIQKNSLVGIILSDTFIFNQFSIIAYRRDLTYKINSSKNSFIEIILSELGYWVVKFIFFLIILFCGRLG